MDCRARYKTRSSRPTTPRRFAIRNCNAAHLPPAPDARSTQRYLFQVLRGLPKEIVYAQMLLGFELALADPRFVGLNMVMPEDYYVSMHDFPLHMRMMHYLHGQYPNVHVTLACRRVGRRIGAA